MHDSRHRRRPDEQFRSCQTSNTLMVDSRLMRKIVLAVCVAMSGAVTLGAQTATSSSNFSVPVVYRKLSNGLRVVVSENHAAPVVVVEVMYRIGFRIEPKNRTGFAHLFEHMMFQ